MTARAAAKVGPGEPEFDEHTARLVASLASMPKKPAKRATRNPEAPPAGSRAKVTIRGVTETRRAVTRTAAKLGPRKSADSR